MSMEPPRPQEYPTEELPTYRKVSAHPEPTSAPADTPHASAWGGTGELPVTGSPITPAPAVVRPCGPHLPTVLSGVFVLALAALVVVWRLADHPNWAVVGISFGVAAGLLFLLAAAISFVVHHAPGHTPQAPLP